MTKVNFQIPKSIKQAQCPLFYFMLILYFYLRRLFPDLVYRRKADKHSTTSSDVGNESFNRPQGKMNINTILSYSYLSLLFKNVVIYFSCEVTSKTLRLELLQGKAIQNLKLLLNENGQIDQ